MKKNNIKKVIVTCIILLLIIIVQFVIIYKYKFIGYMFNHRFYIDKYNIEYLINTKELDIIDEIIPNDENIKFYITGNDNEGFNQILLNLYGDILMYPSTNEVNLYSSKISDENIHVLDDYDIDYVVIIGKGIKLLDVITSKDITVFKYENEKLIKIEDYNKDLYSYKIISDKYNSKSFNELLDYIVKYVDNYSTLFSFTGYNYLEEYTNKLYELKDYDGFKKYYNILEDNGLPKGITYYNYALLEYENENKEEVIKYINHCLEKSDCPNDALNLKEEMENS